MTEKVDRRNYVRASLHLHDLIMQYLLAWRKIANGRNGVTVPDGYFSVNVLRPVEDDPGDRLRVVLFKTNFYTNSTPVYDYDDDEFRPFGSSPEPSYYEYSSGSHQSSTYINLSLAGISESLEIIEGGLKTFVAKDDKRIAEEARTKRITELQAELDQLSSKAEK